MRRAMRFRSPFLLVVSLLGLIGAPQGAIADRLPNILLVSVDTLRADRMSSYGYDRNTSPRIDALLGEGMRFTATSTAASTSASGPENAQ